MVLSLTSQLEPKPEFVGLSMRSTCLAVLSAFWTVLQTTSHSFKIMDVLSALRTQEDFGWLCVAVLRYI